MEHFCSDQWALFAIGKGGETADQMNLHLETCERCAESLRFWQRVAAVVAAEKRYEVPASVLDHIQKAFAAHAKPRRTRVLFPFLRFDSIWEPEPVGVRSGEHCDRTLVYETDQIQVRLRLERKLSPERIWLDGQLLTNRESSGTLGNLRACLHEKMLPLGECLTNAYGEFQFEFIPVPEVELSVELSPETVIVVPFEPLPLEGARL